MAVRRRSVSAISNVPEAFEDVIKQLEVVRGLQERCESDILDESMLSEIDGCTAEFRDVSRGISSFTGEIASVWCTKCLDYFSELQQGVRPRSLDLSAWSAILRSSWRQYSQETHKDDLQLYCSEALQISKAFRRVAKRVRGIAANAHSAEKLAERKALQYLEYMELKEEIAKDLKDKADAEHDEAMEVTREKKAVADGWGMAKMITMFIPVVGGVTTIGHAITKSRQDSAQAEENSAWRRYCNASSELESARSRHRVVEEVHTEICNLGEKITEVETRCEAIAAFVEEKANTFSSKYANCDTFTDFVELGLGSEMAESEVQWLSETKSDLERCHRLMKGFGVSNQGPARCTFEKYGRENISQSWYECYTCWGGESQYGCCAACARSCHSGHELVPGQTRTDICDCGKNKHQKAVCTWHSTKKNYIWQPFYRCYSCFSVANQGCCYQCSKSCHRGHDTRYAGVMKAYCDCGLERCSTTCKIPSPKN